MHFRYVSVILLFSVLAAPLLGGWVWLEVEKKLVKREVKHRMIEGLDVSELTRLVFTLYEAETALEWEHAREFEYRGEMYDVVECFEKNDSVVYLCWWDHEETALNRELRARVQQALQDDPSRQERQRVLVFFFKNLFLEKRVSLQVLKSVRFENVLMWETGVFQNVHYASVKGPPPKWG